MINRKMIGKKAKVFLDDGSIFEGKVTSFLDQDEDVDEAPSDSITIETNNGKIYAAYDAEIKSIEIIEP